MTRRLTIVGLSMALGLLNAGCAANLLGAAQVGGNENATWVYVETTSVRVNGIYRCVDRGTVTCTKAQMR